MRQLRLHARSYGQGEPLVLLHGLFGSAAHWHHIAVRLAGHHRVLAVDLRNHGASPHSAEMDYPALAADVCAVLDERGLRDAAVLGHSMGGKVAMAMALCAPQRVRRLAVVDMAPAVYADTFSPLICAALRLDLAAIQTRECAERLLAPRIPSPSLRAMLLQNLVRRDGAWAWRIGWTAIARNMATLRGFPAALRCCRSDIPALFIRGGESDYVRPGHAALIRARFPQARFQTIAQAGHWVQADRPAELLQAMRAWLS
jgi:esterase